MVPEEDLLPEDGGSAQLTREQRPAEPGQHDVLPGEVQPGDLKMKELILVAIAYRATKIPPLESLKDVARWPH